jgi:hypothetical protein
MGRLDNIIERNQHPRRHGRKGVTMGMLMALFVFVILVLIIFTDFDESPVKPSPAAEPAATEPPSGEKRVNGVLMYREKARPAALDAGGVGSN